MRRPAPSAFHPRYQGVCSASMLLWPFFAAEASLLLGVREWNDIVVQRHVLRRAHASLHLCPSARTFTQPCVAASCIALSCTAHSCTALSCTSLPCNAPRLPVSRGLSLIHNLTRFKIEDSRYATDILAAWACIRLDRLQQGYRFIHLLDAKGLPTPGLLLVKIEKRVGNWK